MKQLIILMMLVAAGTLMSFAWIGHLKFKSWGFGTALLASWVLVMPEYILNVFAVRWGRDVFTAAQMSAVHLCAGVICVALISRFFLGESLQTHQVAGFALMVVSIGLILTG